MERYEAKCLDLKKRLQETEQYNEVMVAAIERTKRMIQRARLERAVLEDQLERESGLREHPEKLETPLTSPPESPIVPNAKNGFGLKGHGKGEDGGTTNGNTRRRAAPRDPRLPKRPQNGYLLFCDAEKDRIRKKLEEQRPGETHDLTRALADAWKAIGEEGRKPFHQAYEHNRVRYLKKMAAFPRQGLSATDLRERQRAVAQLRHLEENPDSSLLDNGDSEHEENETHDVNDDVTEDEDMKPASQPAEEPCAEQHNGEDDKAQRAQAQAQAASAFSVSQKAPCIAAQPDADPAKDVKEETM